PPQQYPPQQYPPQQYPPQQYPPAAYPPQQAPAPPVQDRAPPPRPKKRARDDLGKLVNLRFGWNAYGTGTMAFEGECSGSCPLAVTNLETGASDQTRMLLGLDTLFGPQPFQIGFGLWFMPHVRLEPERGVVSGSADKDLGFEFTTPFIVGGIVPVGEGVSISLRGFVGPQIVFGGGGGAIEQDADAYESFCEDSPGLRECEAGAATRLGLTPGLAGGPLFRLAPAVSLSGDLMLQYTNIELFSFEAAGNGWSAKQTYGYEGIRLWLMLGLGLGS
ncbi:MAG TPA: hypothetical protein VM686_26010, partial [Polyangiaceae bacterium]|nr:hypothetical protein [Polyangiaceae bacterium]